MAKAAEVGKTFIDEVLGKLPDSLRTQAATIFNNAEAQAAIEHVGAGAVRHSDYSSAMDRLRAQQTQLETLKTDLEQRSTKLESWRTQLDGWAQSEQARIDAEAKALEDREKALAIGGGTPPADRKAPGGGKEAPVGGLTETDIAKVVATEIGKREGAFVAFTDDAINLANYHGKHFGDALNVRELMQHPKLGELGSLTEVYKLVHKDKLEKLATDLQAKKDAELRAKHFQEFRDQHINGSPNDLPYPVGDGTVSPFDILALPADKRSKGDPAVAARMYEELVRSNA